MQPVGVAQPLRRILRRDQAAVAMAGDDVLGDRAGFRDGIAAVGDDRRFAERVNRAQLLWRAHVGLALVAHDLVGDAEFFEQPQHALRAGIVEMMNGQHWWPPDDIARWRGGLVLPVARRKVEMCRRTILSEGLWTRIIYPG